MTLSKHLYKPGMFVAGALLAVTAIGVGALTTHADTSNYKQAFTAGNTSTSGIFNVAGDESGVTYALNGTTSATLACQASSGSWVTVATLSGSGTLNAGSISSDASMCNPAITTTAHLIQDMREGKIYFISGGMNLPLSSASVSMTPPAITSTSTPTTGGSTSTSTDMGGAMGGTSTSTMASTTATLSASGLRVALNNLLREHVSSSIDVLRNINDNSPALNASLAQQDANAVDLANAIALVYGNSAGDTFLTEFRAHIADSNAYTEGVKDGSMTNQTQALAALDMQLQALSTFFSTANPNVDYDTLLGALRQHENLVNDASVSYNQGKYNDSYTYEQEALDQISGGADYLAGAIVKQYPSSFTQ